MAYDPRRDRIVLFGGRRTEVPPGPSQRPSDTWEWDGETWMQVEDMGPTGRSESAMAYDERRERVVLFGGMSATGMLNDTWEWDGRAWTQVEDSGPPPMAAQTMAYDPAQGSVLLFRTGTWAWDGSVWAQLNEVGPAPGYGVMAYNPGQDQVLLVVGRGAAGTPPVELPATTWRWDGEAWKQVADMGPIYHSAFACMADDGSHFVLYQTASRQTWEWDGRLWIQRQDIGPVRRRGAAMVGDPARKRCVLFGGDYADAKGDTWALSVKED
jgi:hypothetical protein